MAITYSKVDSSTIKVITPTETTVSLKELKEREAEILYRYSLDAERYDREIKAYEKELADVRTLITKCVELGIKQ